MNVCVLKKCKNMCVRVYHIYVHVHVYVYVCSSVCVDVMRVHDKVQYLSRTRTGTHEEKR